MYVTRYLLENGRELKVEAGIDGFGKSEELISPILIFMQGRPVRLCRLCFAQGRLIRRGRHFTTKSK